MKKKGYIYDKISPAEVFYTILGWTFFVLVNSVLFIISPVIILVTLPFDRQKKVFTYVIKLFCHIFYTLNFVQKTTFIKNDIKPPAKGEKRVYVINHASMFDTILMYSLPGAIKSLMKEAYAKIPVIGWIAVMAGNIVLKEEQTSGSQIGTYMNLIRTLEDGSPIIIYPEGTKSKNSKIGRFYHGSFKIALETQSNIVPVVFDTWNIIRPGGLWIRDVKHTIRILDTIEYDKVKDLSFKQLSDVIKTKLTRGLLEVRDNRRETEKNYYRHAQKYVNFDNEMREDLVKLEEKIQAYNFNG